MDNNENKSKLIKNDHTLYKKSNSIIYPNLNLGDSMGFKNTDVKKGLGLINQNNSNRYGNMLSKSISEQNDPLGIKMIINKNQSDMYKNMWSSTPKFDQVIESLKKRESIIQQISMLPDSSFKRNLELGIKTNVISGLDVTPILRKNRNIINDEVRKALSKIELSINPSYITKGYYKNYSGVKYKNGEVYRKDILTEKYVNVNDIDKLEEVSNNKSLNIDREEMVEFISHAQEYPMLLMEHSVGKKIFNHIKNLKPVKLEGDLHLYRIRTTNKLYPLFNHEQMLKPPFDVAAGGRFDQYGKSVLYTTDSLEISMLETHSPSNNHKYYFMRKYEYDKSLKIADLTRENETDWVDCLLREKESEQEEEYIIPRFVAQCLKYHGFEGFIVDSIHAQKDEKNYIFFYYKENSFNRVFEKNYPLEEVEDIINKYKKERG